MKKEDFYYDLPPNLIAQTPLEDRLSSKLLILNKENDEITLGHFKDVINHMEKGDLLVLNNTKVIPARLYGTREKTNANIELLLLTRKSLDTWEVLVKPGKKAKIGDTISFGNGILKAEIIDIIEDGKRVAKFTYSGVFEEILETLGEMPLPHYICEKLSDKTRYQTVYAKNDGSVAAPTAGLHFTNDFLEEIAAKGINIAYVTLHVGLGTFRPVKEENILNHHMHEEWFEIGEKEADLINETKRNGKKVIAVGTTSVRTLESAANEKGIVKSLANKTDIFIYPGYKFKVVDQIITNFHLPESTLIMLVSAFCGRENTLKAYETAVSNEFRFFSFGDAMFII